MLYLTLKSEMLSSISLYYRAYEPFGRLYCKLQLLGASGKWLTCAEGMPRALDAEIFCTITV